MGFCAAPFTRIGKGLNPTYPGCSAVIPYTLELYSFSYTISLNPTYPGCSAVISTRVSPGTCPGVLILLTLDAAL